MFTANNNRAKRITVTSTVMAFMLAAGACGNSADDGVTAEAASAGVARSFCDAVADLGATIQSDASPAAQASAAAATVELMPEGSPAFATSYFGAIADTTQQYASGGDASAAEQAWANGQHLQVSAFLGSQCPDDEFTSSASFQGMIAMGMDMQTSLGTAAPATTAPAATDDDTTDTTATSNDDSDDTTATTVAPAAVEGETTEFASGVVRTKLLEGGGSGEYAMVEWTIGEVYSSNADEWTVFESEPELGDNDSWLIVEVNGETLANIDVTYRSGEFFLVAPDGTRMNAENVIDRFGEVNYSGIAFDGKENKSAFLVFSTPTIVTSMDGWQLTVVAGDQIPTFIPFVGVLPETETRVDLTPVDAFTATGDNTWPDDCTSQYEVNVLSSAVTVEAVYGNKIRRARVGERYLVVEFDLKNITEDGETSLPCANGASYGFDPEYFRVSVDGRASTPEGFDVPNVDAGNTVAGQAVYIIPKGAQQLQLVGETDAEVFATWQVSISDLPGE